MPTPRLRRCTLHAPSKKTGFIGTVAFHQNADGRTFTTEYDFQFVTMDGWCVYVPKGFVTDLASVPRWLWWLLPSWGTYTDAAVVHDWLYQTQPCSRLEADLVLRAAMQELHTPTWQRVLIYRGVRLGGWYAWRSHRKLTIAR